MRRAPGVCRANPPVLAIIPTPYIFLLNAGRRLSKFGLIPVDLSIKSLSQVYIKNMAGSRTTKTCEPRQVRKEAAAANPFVCCGKPGHQL